MANQGSQFRFNGDAGAPSGNAASPRSLVGALGNIGNGGQPDVDTLMSQYAAQNNNDPEALAHLLMVLNARKGKTDANVSLRHSVKIDTSMKAPVHHRRNIEVTFLSPLLLFEILAFCLWVVGLAGVALWQAKCSKDMIPVRPFYHPLTLPVANSTAALAGFVPKANTDAYLPSYEWFIIWSSFVSIVYMLYVTLFRCTLWQHASAMFLSSITTGVSITHLYYISNLSTMVKAMVYSKTCQTAVTCLYAGLVGWTTMNICAIMWMCLDIDHDIALDEATKQLTQQQNNRSRAVSPAGVEAGIRRRDEEA